MAEQAMWYVVHTYSGYENKVAQDLSTMVENRRLQDLISEVRIPVEVVPSADDRVEIGSDRIVVFASYADKSHSASFPLDDGVGSKSRGHRDHAHLLQ